MNDRARTEGTLAQPPPEVIRELRQLLAGARLSGNGGVSQRGRTLDLLVTVWGSDGPRDSVDVVLSAFCPGSLPYRLDRVAVRALGHAPPGAVWRLGQPAGLGALKFCGLPRSAAGYRLQVLATAGAGPFDLPPDRMAARTDGGDLGTRELRRGRVYLSQDGSVRATVRLTEEGALRVAVESRTEERAGAVVEYAFLEGALGRVVSQGNRTLRPANLPGCWEDSGPAEVFPAGAEPSEFIFGVLPGAPELAPEVPT
jgi:hypothetical protein